jgi:hypothetical protein
MRGGGRAALYSLAHRGGQAKATDFSRFCAICTRGHFSRFDPKVYPTLVARSPPVPAGCGQPAMLLPSRGGSPSRESSAASGFWPAPPSAPRRGR